MNYTDKIKMALAYRGISMSELARALGTTPQAFVQRLGTGKFRAEEMQAIAEAIGGNFEFFFTFGDEKI